VTVSRFIVSRYRPGTTAIRERFKKDRKAKRKAAKLRKATAQEARKQAAASWRKWCEQ
jgi:hypothetical protein